MLSHKVARDNYSPHGHPLMVRVITAVNYYSLDAVLVALLWQQLFWRARGHSVPLVLSVGLALAVWLIYTSDRLLDTWRLPQIALERHLFARQHWRGLALSCLFVLGLLITLTPRLHGPELLAASLLGLLVLGHFVIVHALAQRFLYFSKELMVGVAFAAACSLGLWRYWSDAYFALAVISFAWLCAANCMLIAYLERFHDGLCQERSWLWLFPERARVQTHVLSYTLFAGALCSASFFLMSLDNTFACVSLSFSLLIILWRVEPLSLAVKRSLIDLCLLSPVLVLLWQ